MRLGRFIVQCAALIALALPAAAAPDEELLGKSAGYPLGNRRNWFYDEATRVGSFSNLDKIVPYYYTLNKAPASLLLRAAATEPNYQYRFENQARTLSDFLARQRVTGLLVIKDGEIQFEHYQYDRTDKSCFVSHSMAKSIVSLAVGMALAEGKIASLDDMASKYVPKLAGSPYGETTIRNVLRMSSGVAFNETYDGNDDMHRFEVLRFQKGSIEALRVFDNREAPQGTRFHYASSETVILALVVRAVTGQTLSQYVTRRLWQPMGAEDDATWLKGPDGVEAASGAFNAVLRDYGRLGILLANDGAVGASRFCRKNICWRRPIGAGSLMRSSPGRRLHISDMATSSGLFPGQKRRFALLGVYGQSIFVDPELKLVMVLTGVAKTASVGPETYGAERDAVWRGLVSHYGSW